MQHARQVADVEPMIDSFCVAKDIKCVAVHPKRASRHTKTRRSPRTRVVCIEEVGVLLLVCVLLLAPVVAHVEVGRHVAQPA